LQVVGIDLMQRRLGHAAQQREAGEALEQARALNG
jgi:hypothetical protein